MEGKIDPAHSAGRSKAAAPGTGEQYLFALIKCADWIDPSYRQLAEKNRGNTAIIKELYICACDGVPIEAAMEAQDRTPPEKALRDIRKKHIEGQAASEYRAELAEMKAAAAALENEVAQLSGILKHISDHVTSFDAMFPDLQEPPIPEGDAWEDIQDAAERAAQENPETRQSNVPESGTQKRKYIPFWRRKKAVKISEYVEGLLKEGYSNEQLEYILECLESGMLPEDLRNFISPKIPVDVMKRLQALKVREKGE